MAGAFRVRAEVDAMSEPLGELLDGLGVTHSPAEGELVSDALVLLKVIEEDGSVRLRAAWSDGMSWIERLGMLNAAVASEASDISQPGED